MSEVTDLLDALVAGQADLASVVAAFSQRQWPQERASQRASYEDLARAESADVPVPEEGAFSEVASYYVDGKIDDPTYEALAEAAATAMAGPAVADAAGQPSLFDAEDEDDADIEGKGAPTLFEDLDGKGKPPPIATGSYVSWGPKRGRVDMIVTSGKVPGVEEDVEGSPGSPAARVVVYEERGGSWKATRTRVGVKVQTLRRTAPPTGQKAAPGAPGGDPSDVLVQMLADHQDIAGDDPAAAVDGAALVAVYERGVKAWPGPGWTVLDRQEWGLRRAETFLGLARREPVPPTYRRDRDLLPAAHPAAAAR